MIRVLLIVIVLGGLLVLLLHPWRRETNLLRAPGHRNSWTWFQASTVSAGLSDDGGILKCDVVQSKGDPWDVQLFEMPVELREGHNYHFAFSAKSSRRHLIAIGSELNNPQKRPNNKHDQLGLSITFEVTEEWKPYDFNFTAKNVDQQYNRIPMFALGGAEGAIYLKDIILEETN